MNDGMLPAQQETLEDHLFSSDKNVYAIVDSALSHEIHLMIQGASLKYLCLYEGKEAELLEEAAPYLVQIEQGAELTDWLLKNVYTKNAISFIQSESEIDTLGFHLRQYAKIQTIMIDDQGKQIKQWVFFAFYDPRVFPRFIKSNTIEQSAEFFEGISNFICENTDDKNLLENYHYSVKEKGLGQQTFNLIDTKQEEKKRDKSNA